jgi:hypothetical protein
VKLPDAKGQYNNDDRRRNGSQQRLIELSIPLLCLKEVPYQTKAVSTDFEVSYHSCPPDYQQVYTREGQEARRALSDVAALSHRP